MKNLYAQDPASWPTSSAARLATGQGDERRLTEWDGSSPYQGGTMIPRDAFSNPYTKQYNWR